MSVVNFDGIGKHLYEVACEHYKQGNLEQAVLIFEQAAVQYNHSSSQFQLGVIYRGVNFFGQNEAELNAWHEIFIHDKDAQYEISMLFFRGEGAFPQDYIKAVEYLHRSAQMGHVLAQCHLGQIYLAGEGGLFKDNVKSAEFNRMAANQGYEEAQYQLGIMYREGRGVGDDDEQVFQWIAQASRNGNAIAQCALAHFFERRVGDDMDIKTAFELYLKSAEQGNVIAKCNLGRYYLGEWGPLTEKNPVQALKWLLEATIDYTPVFFYLGKLCEEYPKLFQGPETALDFYRLGAGKHDVLCQHRLGLFFYDETRGAGADVSQAFPYFESAAKQGYVKSMYYLGCMYLYGREVARNALLAHSWFLKAANSDDRDSQHELAKIYEEDLQHEKAMHWNLKAAKNGVAAAKTCIGTYHENGKGVSINYGEALSWYKDAHEGGCKVAPLKVAHLYYNGRGVTKSFERSMQWLKRAANRGNPDACYELGSQYQNGEGMDKDFREAENWYQKSIMVKNDPKVFHSLGVIYDDGGFGIEQDFVKALDYFSLAAELNYVDSHIKLGSLECFKEAIRLNGSAEAYNCARLVYLYGHFDFSQNYEVAEEYFEEAVDGGSVNAIVNIGLLYFYGNSSIKKDTEKALKFFEEAVTKENHPVALLYIASKLGNSDADQEIGNLFRYGLGVQKDFQKALKWYKKASNNGNADALCSIGEMYENGEGLEKDEDMAVEYYGRGDSRGSLAASLSLQLILSRFTDKAMDYALYALFDVEKGFMDKNCSGHASYLMGKIRSEGLGVERDDGRALSHFRRAADRYFFFAYCSIGDAYKNGKGVFQNHTEAMIWYGKAAIYNVGAAQYNIGMLYLESPAFKRNSLTALDFFKKAKLNGIEDAERYITEIEKSLKVEGTHNDEDR